MGLSILLAGASGEVGKRLLDNLIASNLVDSIHLVNRRPHPTNRIKVTQHNINFEKPIQLDNEPNFDLAFCCLGTTIKKAGSKAAFESVDFQYVAQFAQLAKQHNCQQFAVISSIGANPIKGGFYLQTKGRMEAHLQSMEWPSLYIFRPSLLTGKRQEFRLGEQLGSIFGRLISPFLVGPLHKYRPINMNKVASAMAAILTAESNSGVKVLEGDDILKLAN
jgi:uncharacterized protein YbjT (DUF2867 family)